MIVSHCETITSIGVIRGFLQHSRSVSPMESVAENSQTTKSLQIHLHESRTLICAQRYSNCDTIHSLNSEIPITSHALCDEKGSSEDEFAHLLLLQMPLKIEKMSGFMQTSLRETMSINVMLDVMGDRPRASTFEGRRTMLDGIPCDT